MKKRVRRRQGGSIMLAVIFVLLALALAVTAFYTQSEDHQYLGVSMNNYSLAAARAEMGAQEALSRVRSGALNVNILNNVLVPCASTGDPFTACTNKLGPVLVDNGPTINLKGGGGLQYQYIVYMPDDKGAPANLYTIRARGYYGYSLTSMNLYTSDVEITVQKGDTGSGFKVTDTYDNVTPN